MKCALIISEGIKQIMLSPETPSEKATLALLTPEEHISVEIKPGTLYDSRTIPEVARGYVIQECSGGYLRAYEQVESVMLVLRAKKKDEVKTVPYNDLTSV